MPDSLSPAAVPASTASSDLESLLAKMGQQAKSAEGEAATERSEAQARIDEARAQLHKLDESAAAMKPPEFKEAPPAPAPTQTNPWQTFGSPAMILAALGGFLTQTPLITALNAGAKVMQATAQGDAAETQRQMDIWKVAVENASRANTFEMSKYTAAIEKLGSDRADARAELTAAMSALGDARGLDILAMGDDKALLNYMADKQHFGEQMMLAAPQVQAWHSFIQGKITENGSKPLSAQQMMDAFKEFQTLGGGQKGELEAAKQALVDAYRASPDYQSDSPVVRAQKEANILEGKPAVPEASPGDVAKAWKPVVVQLADGSYVNAERNDITKQYRDSAFKPIATDQVKEALTGARANQVLTFDDLRPENPSIKAIADYKAPPGSNWGANTEYARKLMGAVLAANPQYDAGKWQQHVRVLDDFANGMSARRMDSVNAIIQHYDVIEGAAKALQNGTIQKFNAAKQEVWRQMGYSAPTTFDALSLIVSQEGNAVILGRGAGTVDERTAAQASVLNKANSPAQIADGAKAMKQLMAGQANAMRQRWVSTPGLDAKDFDAKLTPEALEALRERGYESIGGAAKAPDTDPLGWFQ